MQIATRIAAENYVGERLFEYQEKVLPNIKDEFEYQIKVRHYSVQVQRWYRTRKMCRQAERWLAAQMTRIRRQKAVQAQAMKVRQAVKIQSLWRRVVARSFARAEFGEQFVVGVDPESRSHFYTNLLTGASMVRVAVSLCVRVCM